jgi:DNA polymerase I
MKRILCRTIQEVKDLLSSLNTTVFSFDTETNAKEFPELEIIGISFCDGSTAGYIYINDTNRNIFMTMIYNYFMYLDKKSVCIAHNIVYDAKVLYKYNTRINCEWFDTMIAQHLLDENSEYGLKYLSRTILEVKDAVDYSDTNKDRESDDFGNYGMNDAIYTYQLAMLMQPQLKKLKLDKLFRKIEMPFQRVLLQMSITGVLIDKAKLSIFTDKLQKELINKKSQLYDILDKKYSLQCDLFGNIVSVEGDINFDSSLQLSDIMFNQLGLEVVEKTETGKSKTGKITLAKHKENEFVKALTEYKVSSKLYNAFIKPMPEHINSDGRVRPFFNDCGARTGRLSSSNPNLQQLPKSNDYSPVSIRELFIVPEGYKMITCDYSGQEVCVMAEQSKDDTLVNALRKGYDMHLAIANQFYNLGIPAESLETTNVNYEMYKSKFKKQRTQAKVITFGLAYGKGAFGFSKDFGITEEEAQKIVDDYFKGMPKLKKCIDETHLELRKNGYVRSMAGRIRHFDKNEQGYYPGTAFRQSFNFKIQGFSADMIRVAMVNVLTKKHPKEWELKAIGTVHDESIYQVKEEYVTDASKYIKECFETAVNFVVPVKADIGVGNSYEEAK